MPLAIHFIKKANSSQRETEIIDAFVFCATHYNSAIDPIIYAFRMKDVQQKILSTLKCVQRNVALEVSETRSMTRKVTKV